MRVAIQVYALAEPDLERTLNAYAACEVPSFVSDIQYQACVTPRVEVAARTSLDNGVLASLRELVARDVAAARRHPVFEFVETPPGKLTSRNKAHHSAVRAGADVFVVGDGDAPPANDTYLHELLRPFENQSCIATNGFSKPRTIGSFLIQPARHLDRALRKPLYGRSSAILTDGWDVAGPFRAGDIDESNAIEVRQEEEFAFRQRLEDHGRVVDVPKARVYNDNRRYKCSLDRGFSRFGRPMSSYCGQIGVETFQPK